MSLLARSYRTAPALVPAVVASSGADTDGVASAAGGSAPAGE